MERFQHMMRTMQHAKSVEQIMTRTNSHFFNSKKPKKLSPQGDNITTYLRKFQIDRQNLNLAKRIMQCESQHSRDKYVKEWSNTKRFLQVRSNFKKTLHAKAPQIYKVQPILGKGKLLVNIEFGQVNFCSSTSANKKLYKFCFILGHQEIQPDKKLLKLDCINGYTTSFYAPLYLRKKSITCKILQIIENNAYQFGRFQINFSQNGKQQVEIKNRFCKKIGDISFNLKVQGGRRKSKQKYFQEDKENINDNSKRCQNQGYILPSPNKIKLASQNQG